MDRSPDETQLPTTSLGSGKNKIRPPAPPPPPPPPPPESSGEPYHPRLPPGLESVAVNASAPRGYEGGRPPAPPVPPGNLRPSPKASPMGGPAAAPTLVDGLDSGDEGGGKKLKPIFEPHLDKDAVEKGLRDGTLIRGALRVNGTKPSQAYVQPDGEKARMNDIIVIGRAARNRAVQGDIVVVKLVMEGEAALRAGSAAAAIDEEAEDEEDMARRPGTVDDSDEEIIGFQAIMPTEQDDARQPQETSSASASRARSGRGGGGGNDKRQGVVVAIADPKGTSRVIVCTLHPNTHNRRKRRKKVRDDEAAEAQDEEGEEPREDDDVVGERDNVLRAVPTDHRMPWILIQVNEVTKNILKIPGRLDKEKLWPVQMVKWIETSQLPLGRLKGECIGTAGDLKTEEKHALIEQGLDDHEADFSEELEEEVEGIVAHANANFEREASRRMDLRKKRVFTIDPATARDLDDAIHVDDLPHLNQVEIGVHIADVGHFLKLGGISDKEAQRRTTSVYMISGVLPMLHRMLCNHLCSLNPNEPKLSFSAFFRLDAETGELVRDPPPWFKKTVMTSVCRMNYDQVQFMLDGEAIEPPAVHGGHTWEEVKADIHILHKVCGAVRHGRLSGGAMTINKAKMIFHTRESADGVPTGYHLEEHSASHWIIEELMLLANRCVAEYLHGSRLSECAVLRKHEKPEANKAQVLQKLLSSNLRVDVDWDSSSAGSIYESCKRVYQKYGHTLGMCVEMMVMRCGMQQAAYFAVTEEDNPHHFALNFDYYTHFTSPIRRYPDVMVHRVLAELVATEETGDEYQDAEKANDQCAICNEKRSCARRLQEQLDRAVFCVYLRARKEWYYTVGTVLGFKEDPRNAGNDMVTVYSSQMGIEKKMKLCTAAEIEKLQLWDRNESEKLQLPQSWKFEGRGSLDLFWEDPEDGKKQKQGLRVLSCVAIVIIPTKTVPIDFEAFILSPFHKKHGMLSADIKPEEAEGFEWQVDPDDEGLEGEGVEVVFNAAPKRAPGRQD